jgi:hypothetical protein
VREDAPCEHAQPGASGGAHLLAGRAAPQVEGVGEEAPREAHAAELGELVHLVVDRLGGGVPRLVVLHVAVVLFGVLFWLFVVVWGVIVGCVVF